MKQFFKNKPNRPSTAKQTKFGVSNAWWKNKGKEKKKKEKSKITKTMKKMESVRKPQKLSFKKKYKQKHFTNILYIHRNCDHWN